jgi:hypothetical protein
MHQKFEKFFFWARWSVVIVCESHVDRGSPCQFSGASMKIRHATKPKIVKGV